jgi:peptidoglycan/xylan/chitin deacetylase (PgdA/CDA1 family)
LIRLNNIISRPLNGKGAILCFHRVLPDDEIAMQKGPNEIGLIYSVSNFESLLKWLTKRYKIFSLDDLISHINSDSQDFAIALTFDDGYKDNLVYAFPILEKYSAPATIYVTINFLEKDTLIWWFELWDIICSNNKLDFIFNETNYKFNLDCFEKKLVAFDSLKKLFLSLTTNQHFDLFNRMTNTFNFKSYKNSFLNYSELIFLDKHPLITIGAHTTNHENLKNLSSLDLYNEYLSCKSQLESIVKHPINHFAYPYGNSTEANIREYKILEKAGYKSGVTLRSFFLSGVDLMSLVRIPITNDLNIDYLNFLFNIIRKRKDYFHQLFVFLKQYILKIIKN